MHKHKPYGFEASEERNGALQSESREQKQIKEEEE